MTPTPPPTPVIIPTLTPYPTGVPGVDTLGFTWTYGEADLLNSMLQGAQVWATLPRILWDTLAAVILMLILFAFLRAITNKIKQMSSKKPVTAE